MYSYSYGCITMINNELIDVVMLLHKKFRKDQSIGQATD